MFFKLKKLKKKIKETCIEKFGVQNPSQSEAIKKKKENTCFKNYGTAYFMQSEVGKINMKQTCNEKYDCDWATQSYQMKEKAFETNLKKYDNKCSLHGTTEEGKAIIEKVKNAINEKYGTTYYIASDDFKQKYKQTCNTKYGVDNVSQLQEIKDKKDATMLINHTYAKSEPEDNLYFWLVKIFGKEDVFHQYNTKIFENSDRYPFKCDIYIKHLDMFIEVNLYFTHGGHPFNKENKCDIVKIKKWKTLAEKYNSDKYRNAIENWTIRDPLKIKTAKEHNLNYVMLWNKLDIENFKKYILTLKK